MHIVTGQVEVVVRTLKLVLRSFQRSWMKSEQSSSEQVNESLLFHARVDATTTVAVVECWRDPQPIGSLFSNGEANDPVRSAATWCYFMR